MWKMIVRRFLIIIPQMFLLTIIVFGMSYIMPGDALTGLIDPTIRPEEIERLRELMGLNRPFWVRYWDWFTSMLQGDFGNSFHHARPVTHIIGDRLPNTIRLSLVATVFTYMIAVPLGMLAGRFRETIIDKTIIAYTFFAMAMPTIIFALINLFVFGFTLNWFPIVGSVDPRIDPGTAAYWLSRLRHLILPALTGALLSTIFIINVLRSQIIDNENSDFVTTARAKGVPRRVIYNRHIFRNAALPVYAGIGFAIVGLLGGSIFIEQVFGFPGMGQLFVSSITRRDFTVVNALIMFYGTATMVGTMLSDIFITIADPRIRIQ
ncbi:MAG: ABC transporter permease [Defluviitaleaceae bacterium]|nr:ABC transporter permease [Defluviitaleaceae bacterium]